MFSNFHYLHIRAEEEVGDHSERAQIPLVPCTVPVSFVLAGVLRALLFAIAFYFLSLRCWIALDVVGLTCSLPDHGPNFVIISHKEVRSTLSCTNLIPLSCNSIVCGSLFIVRQLVSFACSLFLVRLACRVTDNLDEWPHHSCDRKTSRGNIQLFNLRHTIVKIKFLASNYALEVPSLMRMVPEKHFQGDTPSTLKVP